MMYLAIAITASMALATARSPTTTADGNGYSESSEPTICYGDDECRGRQVCDMGSYICVDPTPSPVTTALPGCCYGDSYKANGKCNKATHQGRCESNGCSWLVTYDARDCEMTTTTSTTTTEEPGCCMGDSSKTNPMCNAREGRERCEKSSSCHFVSGGIVDIDCLYVQTTTTPGCCYINPDQAYSKKYQETCTGFYTERDCLKLTDSNGATRCVFEELIEGYDCSLLWPTTTTTTEEPGCCKGDSAKSNPMCNKRETRDQCERS